MTVRAFSFRVCPRAIVPLRSDSGARASLVLDLCGDSRPVVYAGKVDVRLTGCALPLSPIWGQG